MIVVISLLLFSVWLYLSCHKYHQHLSMMDQMMVTMASSMALNWTFGLYIGGIFHHGSFGFAALLSLLAGAVLGTVIGNAFSSIAMIEGGFSGSMAAIMGAMSAVMMTLHEVNSFLLFSLLTSFIVLAHIVKKRVTEKDAPYPMRTKIIQILGLLIFTYAFIHYPPLPSSDEPNENHMNHHPHEQHETSFIHH
ncbi:hypothetical protein [Texcoconibacillus texcoconensis]|uniref:Cellulose synthase/poly-beta-1,6-N-acetylglucosamine synthase-like glycosyltransferase n=1 Tax=Texcoconibacillus texcoconensis TaxID=1095777 RepID=A0A840QSK0_9BACI|nr:hypothetical protein [Texcoconibacillus texcoconensis]MBB5174247.1 cellulose synthase/poly-beta-1,6-N-acetylglucosamine synthase-like glycosyltransferase [Texcoconibacillus texcoconensis]